MTTTAIRACPGHGARVGGRYDVDALLVADGSLCVHEGRDSVLRRRVLIHLAVGANAAPASGWLPLPDGVRLGRGPGLAEVFDGGRDGDTLYLVTQRAEGDPLTEELRAGSLTDDEVRDLGLRVAAALIPLHRVGAAHGALGLRAVTRTSEGVLIGEVGAREWIARWAGVETAPPFPAPESRRGAPPGPPADVYALGRVLSATAGPSTDPVLVRLVDEMTARDPAARPDVETVVRRLVTSWPAGSDVRRSARRRMALASAAVALACAAALAVGGPRLFAATHGSSGAATVGIGAPAMITAPSPEPALPEAAVLDGDPPDAGNVRRLHGPPASVLPVVTRTGPGRTLPPTPERGSRSTPAPPPRSSGTADAPVHARSARSTSTASSRSTSTASPRSTASTGPTSTTGPVSEVGPTSEADTRRVDATERTAPSTSSRSD